MTKRKTQDPIQPTNKRKKEDEDEDSEYDGVKEVVPPSPSTRSKRQQRQIIKQDDSSDFDFEEEEEEKKKKKRNTKKKAAAKKEKKVETKPTRQQIGAFFNKVNGDSEKKSESPPKTPEKPPSNPPSPQKSPKSSPKKSPKASKNKNNSTTKSPPPPLPQPGKLHPFFASKEQRLALEKEREAAELKQREEQLREKERQLAELEQKNKANPPALIFLTKEQKIKRKLEQERDALIESVRKSREETLKLSEGKEAHPFLLPRAFERSQSEKSEDRSSSMLIFQLKLPYFPEIPHVYQESPTSSSAPVCETNGHLASRTRVRDKIRAAAQAEVPVSDRCTLLDNCKDLHLIPHFTEMMSIPKDNRQKVRSCTIKNKTITDDMLALEERGATKVLPYGSASQLFVEYKKKHLAFCPYENYNTTEENPLWTETYRPQNSSEILGNKDCVTLLHSWLDRWREKEERRWAKAQAPAKPKLKRLKRDKGEKLSNAVLLVGPHGSAKTASVYAVAKELGFQIIETNASCRRTGKQLTELFGEAIKSHQLQKTATSGDDDSSSATRFTHSLILVEEVDIQHEDDKGFIPTLIQLSTTTKRPFVFVCNEITPAIRQLREATGLCTINFTVSPVSLITYPLCVISAIEGTFVEEGDVTNMSLLNLQFWTQGCQLIKEKLDSLKLPTVPVYNRWLGFGDFERKYGSNLWVMLENSAKVTVRDTPDLGTPKGGRKKRNSTGKGKRGKEAAETTTASYVPYDSFWDDQERFLSHSLSLGLDFVFLHYLTLLSTPYFPEELFISIANKATQQNCTIDFNNTNLQTSTPPTNPPTDNTDVKTDTTDITTTDANYVEVLISDISNDSVLTSSQDSQTSQTSQPPQTPQLPQVPQTPQPEQQIVKFVEKDSEEFRMAQIGCAALDAMACAADTLSLRDMLSGRDVRLDLIEYIDEREDERIKDRLEVSVTGPSFRSDWPTIPFDEELITSLSALSLHRIHSTQREVHDQLTSHNLAPTSSDLLSRTSSDLLSRASSDLLSPTSSDLLSPTSSDLSSTFSHLSTTASQSDDVMLPNNTTKLQHTLPITRYDGLLLHTREHERVWNKMDNLIEPLPVTARCGRQCMAVEYMPFIQQICEYESLRKKSNPKRRDRFRHYLGIDGTDFQQKIHEYSMSSTCK